MRRIIQAFRYRQAVSRSGEALGLLGGEHQPGSAARRSQSGSRIETCARRAGQGAGLGVQTAQHPRDTDSAGREDKTSGGRTPHPGPRVVAAAADSPEPRSAAMIRASLGPCRPPRGVGAHESIDLEGEKMADQLMRLPGADPRRCRLLCRPADPVLGLGLD